MFEKRKLNKELQKQMELIETLEKKRYRSQAKLVEAILTGDAPDDEDVEYFNEFTRQIEETRARIKSLKNQISEL